MPTFAKGLPLAVFLSALAGCGGNAARPDGGAGSGGADAAAGGAQGTGGAVGSGGAAHTGGAGGHGEQGGAAGGRGGGQAGAGNGGHGGQSGQGAAGGGQSGHGAQGGKGGQSGQAGQAGQGGNAACASAVSQGTCTSEGTVCSSGCTDVCQACNSLRCQGGRWTSMEAAPAPCFMCGTTARCQKNEQYCYIIMGGAATNPPSYQCRATPNACLPTPSCACLQTAPPVAVAGNCAQGGTGELTVTLLAP